MQWDSGKREAGREKVGGDKGNLAPHEQHFIFNSAQTIAVTQKQETRHKDGGMLGLRLSLIHISGRGGR